MYGFIWLQRTKSPWNSGKTKQAKSVADEDLQSLVRSGARRHGVLLSHLGLLKLKPELLLLTRNRLPRLICQLGDLLLIIHLGLNELCLDRITVSQELVSVLSRLLALLTPDKSLALKASGLGAQRSQLLHKLLQLLRGLLRVQLLREFLMDVEKELEL